MRASRLLQPLFLAFALLAAQQGAAAHALGHLLGQIEHQDKKAPHSPACEQCAAYAQIGSALHVSAFNLIPAAAHGEAVPHRTLFFRSASAFAPAARAPPSFP